MIGRKPRPIPCALLSTQELKNVREAMENQLDRIEWKLDQILGALMVKAYDAPSSGEVSPSAPTSHHHVEMPQFTTKQHAALQMLLRGADNNEIAERFNVSPNTSKVYVRSIARKLDVQTRAQIVVKLLDAFNDFDDNSYRMLTGGLPKDWDQNYAEPDPFAHLYRVERGEDDA